MTRHVVEIDPAELWDRLPAALAGSGPALLPGGPAVLAGPLGPEEDADDDPTAVVVATSGSTGAPKGVLISANALTSSANATHTRLGGPGRWLLATPARYVGGIQVVVRSLLNNTPPVVMDLANGFRAGDFARAAEKLLNTPGRHYTALVPTQLARLVEGPAREALAAMDGIVMGGASLSPELRAAAEGLAIVSAYGMSETASGCVYDGVPLDGVRVRLVDGRIAIAGPTLARGYRGRPDLTAESFVAGWFVTSDLGRFVDGRLEVLGRADDVINTGGVKVPASAVERVLERHARAACVVALDHPEWGEIVAAVVVDPQVDITILKDHVREELGPPAVPKVLNRADELPLRGPGKVDRAAVRAYLAGQPKE
jgi:O-succinylbenzoic acid--CoA ligase